MSDLYCDGGCIGPNPSPHGGTWAARLVDGNGGLVWAESGIVTPADLGQEKVTNNNSELLALLEGIERLTPGWGGTVHSDSQCALGWLFLGWSTAKVSAALLPRLLAARALVGDNPMIDLAGIDRNVKMGWRLLQGHPTAADLKAGTGAKRGLPVSAENVACHEECERLGREFLKNRSGEPT